jgi:hypothetical protein
MKSVKRSMALKGNQNAKGARGGATVGTIGGLFGAPGSLVAGMVAQNHANKTLGSANKAQGQRVLKRQRQASTSMGATYGALSVGTKAALVAHPATFVLGAKAYTPLLLASGMGMTKGAVVAGIGGAIVGAAIGGGANYLASRAGSAIIGGPKTNTPKLYHARSPAMANAKALQKHMKAGKPLPTFGTVKLKGV